MQDRLGSAGNVEDINKRYPYPVVDALIAKCYSDLWDSDPESMQDMAIEYDLTLATDNGYYADLSIRPVGSSGIQWVEGNKVFIPVYQGATQSKLLGIVEPNRIPGCRLINGSRLVFDSQPQEPLKALYIPNYSDLADTDNVVLMGADSLIYKMVVQLVQATDGAPEEFYNDGRNDARPVPKKNEFRNPRQ